MITIEKEKFNYYFTRMQNGDWKDQTIKNMLTRLSTENLVDFLAAKCAFEQYKINK